MTREEAEVRAKALLAEAWRQTCAGPLEFDDYAQALIADAILSLPAPAGVREASDAHFTDNTCEDRRLLAAGYMVCGSNADREWHWRDSKGKWHDGYKTEHAAVKAALAALPQQSGSDGT